MRRSVDVPGTSERGESDPRLDSTEFQLIPLLTLSLSESLSLTLSSDNKIRKLTMSAYTYNFRTEEAEA